MSVDEGEFFREVTLRICSSLDIDQALSQAFHYIRNHVPADAIGLGFGDLGAARIHVVARCVREGYHYLRHDDAREIPLSKDEVEYLRAKPTDRPAVNITNRPDNEPEAKLRLFPELRSQSALSLRLDIGREEVGALLLSADGLDRYSNSDAGLIRTVREPFAIAMINARRYRELVQMKDLLAEDNRALHSDIKRALGLEVIGADGGLREVMELVREVAMSSSPKMILGETGTGKEVVAHAIHKASPRAHGPMISMQCGAVPESLLDSELFGHEKGAFTGAVERKRGRFERAQGGTLFLDEIGELSPGAQVKLLRVLQEKCFERVGGTETIKCDVQVIAATHRDLGQMVRENTFREDLWYRLNVLPISIPPLRLRREDIPALLRYFLERKTQEMNLLRTPRIAAKDLERLKAYGWPGNVRELQNIVERALILSHGDALKFPGLDIDQPVIDTDGSEQRAGRILTMDQVIANHIRAVLEQVDWQVAGDGGAAELLQMNPSTLRFRMKKLGIRRRQRRNT